jgi:hypothetical protein
MDIHIWNGSTGTEALGERIGVRRTMRPLKRSFSKSAQIVGNNGSERTSEWWRKVRRNMKNAPTRGESL